jgi:hypothetical protein
MFREKSQGGFEYVSLLFNLLFLFMTVWCVLCNVCYEDVLVVK